MDDKSERFAKMTNQKRRSVLRRGAVWGLTRGRGRPVPLSRSVSAKAHDLRNRRLQSRSDNLAKRSLEWLQAIKSKPAAGN